MEKSLIKQSLCILSDMTHDKPARYHIAVRSGSKSVVNASDDVVMSTALRICAELPEIEIG